MAISFTLNPTEISLDVAYGTLNVVRLSGCSESRSPLVPNVIVQRVVHYTSKAYVIDMAYWFFLESYSM